MKNNISISAMFAKGINLNAAQFAGNEQMIDETPFTKVRFKNTKTDEFEFAEDEKELAAMSKNPKYELAPEKPANNGRTSRAARNIRKDVPATRERLVAVSNANQAASLRVPDFAIADAEAGFEVNFTGKIIGLVEVQQTQGNPYGKSLIEGDYKIQSGNDAGKIVNQKFAILFNSAKHDVGLPVNLKLVDNDNTASGKGWEEA